MSTIANLIANTTTTLAALGVKLALVPAIQGKPTAQRIDGTTPDWQRAKPILEANRGLLYHSLGLNLGHVYTYSIAQSQDERVQSPTLDGLARAAKTLCARIVDMRFDPPTHRDPFSINALVKRFPNRLSLAIPAPDYPACFYQRLFNAMIDEPILLICDCETELCHRLAVSRELRQAGLMARDLSNNPLEPLYLRYRQAITSMHVLAEIAGDDTELSRLERILDKLDACYHLQQAKEMTAAWKEGMNQE